MAREREERRSRERAGSEERDSKHRAGGEWTTITIPEGIEMFQPDEGTYRFDIIPYEVGEGNPFSRPGKWYYERTFYTHRGIGPDNESHVCSSKTARKACFVCEHRAEMAKDPDGDEKLIKNLKPKERQLWLIRLRHKGEVETKVKLWEFSFYGFGKLLDFKRDNAEEDEIYKRNFDDFKGGATLKVTFVKESAGKDMQPFLKAGDIEFIPRPDGLEEEILDHGICLDKCVKVRSYDELKKLYLQISDESEQEEKKDRKDNGKGSKESKSKPKDDDWDDEKKEEPKEKEAEKISYEEGQKVRHRQFGVCEVARIFDDGSLGLVGIEGENKDKRFKGVDPKNVKPLSEEKKSKPKDDDWDDDEKKEEPKSNPTKTTKSPSKEEEKSEKKETKKDDWDDDPTPPKKEKKSKPKDDDWD